MKSMALLWPFDGSAPKVLARALKCHPGVLVFPGWELPEEAAA